MPQFLGDTSGPLGVKYLALLSATRPPAAELRPQPLFWGTTQAQSCCQDQWKSVWRNCPGDTDPRLARLWASLSNSEQSSNENSVSVVEKLIEHKILNSHLVFGFINVADRFSLVCCYYLGEFLEIISFFLIQKALYMHKYQPLIDRYYIYKTNIFNRKH